jgi:hypothetical protein
LQKYFWIPAFKETFRQAESASLVFTGMTEEVVILVFLRHTSVNDKRILALSYFLQNDKQISFSVTTAEKTKILLISVIPAQTIRR